jgi:hypothetical protein
MWDPFTNWRIIDKRVVEVEEMGSGVKQSFW